MLQQSLITNAVFSACSAAIILIFGTILQQLFPLPEWLWIAIAFGLLVFAIDLVVLAFKPGLARRLTPLVIGADIGWVMLTFMACLAFWDAVAPAGIALVCAVNIVVGTLALWGYQGYRADLRHSATEGEIQPVPG